MKKILSSLDPFVKQLLSSILAAFSKCAYCINVDLLPLNSNDRPACIYSRQTNGYLYSVDFILSFHMTVCVAFMLAFYDRLDCLEAA